MLRCFFFLKKKIAKGLDRTVLTGSSGPTPVLTVHGINKKSGSLGLKNRFLSRFPVFTVRPPGPVRFWKQWLLVGWVFDIHQKKYHFVFESVPVGSGHFPLEPFSNGIDPWNRVIFNGQTSYFSMQYRIYNKNLLNRLYKPKMLGFV